MHTEGHDMGKPEGVQAHAAHTRDSEHPGYETSDVNVGGTITFLGGLIAFVAIFFVFCFFMGKAINYFMLKSDGTTGKYQANLSQPGVVPGPRENLKSNAQMEQLELKQVTQAFPTPVLETDDGLQNTADLHAKEDLLLNFYSTSSDLPAGTVRIPVEEAMKLVVERGLPKATATTDETKLMAGESKPEIQVPLTTGFARTGYELQTIAAREQKNEFEKAEGNKE
jgi:hypothetical protein